VAHHKAPRRTLNPRNETIRILKRCVHLLKKRLRRCMNTEIYGAVPIAFDSAQGRARTTGTWHATLGEQIATEIRGGVFVRPLIKPGLWIYNYDEIGLGIANRLG